MLLARMLKPLFTIIILFLVVLGLNTSNQGINQVSGESRKPVFNVFWRDHVLYWDWLGVGHKYSTAPLENGIKHWVTKSKRVFQ